MSVSYEGHLYKQGSKVSSNWVKRYYIIQTNLLLRYKKKPGSKSGIPSNTLDLTDARVSHSGIIKFAISITTKDSKTIFLSALSANEVSDWITALTKATGRDSVVVVQPTNITSIAIGPTSSSSSTTTTTIVSTYKPITTPVPTTSNNNYMVPVQHTSPNGATVTSDQAFYKYDPTRIQNYNSHNAQPPQQTQSLPTYHVQTSPQKQHTPPAATSQANTNPFGQNYYQPQHNSTPSLPSYYQPQASYPQQQQQQQQSFYQPPPMIHSNSMPSVVNYNQYQPQPQPQSQPSYTQYQQPQQPQQYEQPVAQPSYQSNYSSPYGDFTKFYTIKQ